MRKNTSGQKGSIICTASNAGIYPFPIAPMYGTSKHAVVGAVRSLAKPLEADGIRINGICPNVIGIPPFFVRFAKLLRRATATGLADNNLFSSMTLTPISLAVDAVRELATNTQLMGVTAEISGNKYTFREQPEWVDEISRTNFEQFWKLGYA
jgi:NAD(P)-dependent dehydrogenase (short-subunit alcohol dehydrogenase family)